MFKTKFAAVQSCWNAICCSGMGTETARCSEEWQKRDRLFEPRGQRCYSSKENSLQGIAAGRILFGFAVRWGVKVRSPHGEEIQDRILGVFRTYTGFQLAKSKKIFWQSVRVFAARDLILLDPSKT